MMNKKKHSRMIAMFAKVAIMMLVLGMFATAVAYAETPRERYQNAQEQYQTYKDRVRDAQNYYQNARERFLDAKEKFENARTRENTLALKEATRAYLNHTIDYAIRHLEAFKLKVEVAEENGLAPFEASENIEGYIDQLEGLRDDVASAETRDDFLTVIREIRDIWLHVNLEYRYFIMVTLNNKVDALLEHSESISDRIEAEIDRLNEVNVDTTALEKLLAEYNEALDDANDAHEQAIEQFDAHKGFDDNGNLVNAKEAREFLSEAGGHMRETHQALKEANSILKRIFIELKQHRPGSVDLNGTGILTASGNGKATLSGNLTIEVSAKSGVLTIIDYGGDAEIEVTGKGTKMVMADGTIRYTDFDGTATISGSSITVVITGNDIELTAEGTGSAILTGHGTYVVEMDDGQSVSDNWAVQTQTTAQIMTQSGIKNQIQPQIQVKVGTPMQNQTQNQTPMDNQTMSSGGK